MDVIPYMLIGGRPAKHYRLNSVGLRRAGINGERYKILSSAFRLLKNKMSLDDLEQTEELTYLKKWLEYKSKRGTHGFVEVSKKSS
jgi:UDP-N-acetylglucosamine acyltransferase